MALFDVEVCFSTFFEMNVCRRVVTNCETSQNSVLYMHAHGHSALDRSFHVKYI